MANTNFVCFTCRTVRRYPKWTGGHRCQFCSQPLHFSYHKFRIPGKRDPKGWQVHQERVYAYNADVRTRCMARYQERMATLRATIASVDKRNVKYISDLQERIRENEMQIRRWVEW